MLAALKNPGGYIVESLTQVPWPGNKGRFADLTWLLTSENPALSDVVDIVALTPAGLLALESGLMSATDIAAQVEGT